MHGTSGNDPKMIAEGGLRLLEDMNIASIYQMNQYKALRALESKDYPWPAGVKPKVTPDVVKQIRRLRIDVSFVKKLKSNFAGLSSFTHKI